MGSLTRPLAVVGLLVAIWVRSLAAQGVTTGALYGVVHGPDSSGIGDAVVTVTNLAGGERWRTTTRGDGRFAFEYLSVGGPYNIEARAIGFRPIVESGITLSLGERRRADLTLTPVITQLAELTVQAPDAMLNGSRTGPSQTFTAAQIAALPLDHRDFSRMVLLSPQAMVSRDTGISIAGQPDRLNGLQIDGASALDLGGIHGISGFGTPGAASNVRVLPIEAIQELQVLTAPFDVRYSGFAGGLVNVITRSGSNRWEGSVSSYFQNESLTGSDSAGNRAQDFSTMEATVTIGGPIVRNRAAFFLDAGLQRFVGEQGPSIGTLGSGVHQADLVRFQDILRDVYRVDPGTIGPAAPRIPGGNLLAKVTVWPALNQRLDLSHNHAEGTSTRGFGAYELSSHGGSEPATFDGSRATWTVGGGRTANELTLARVAATQQCLPGAPFPEIDVDVGTPDVQTIQAGAVNVCPNRFADQTTWELTDNLLRVTGAHHLTLGTHAENIHLGGSHRVRVPAGRWHFASLDALEDGLPDLYIRDFAAPDRPEGPISDVTVRQAGLYLQDQWAPRPGFVLTAGLRFDVPFLPHGPPQNPTLLHSNLGVNTARTPSGNVLWSPRLGFNWDVGGRATTFLRGGAGLFAGRPMYLYFSNVYETTGLDWLRAECHDADVPRFTIDPAHQPTSCLQSDPFVFEVNYFNPSFRFPRNLRLSLGSDLHLPWAMVGTVDLLYIHGVDQFDITDVNLKPPTTASAGEGGRLLYGTIDEVGNGSPNRQNPDFGTVAEIRNSSGDHSISASGQLEKRFRGTEVTLAYTYTDAHDRFSPDCFNVTCNLYLTPLDGTVESRALTTSTFSVRHKITLGVISEWPMRIRVGLFYVGSSGRPYTYMIHGDANADGLRFVDFDNDIMYLPRNAADITLAHPGQWPGLDSLIRSQHCLESQRGRIMRRNSCQGQWANLVNARVSKAFGTGGGRSVELIADLFNLLNLLDPDWGVQRFTPSALGDPEILQLVGYDQAHQRGVYDAPPIDRRVRDDGATRWRMQLGARYTF
jgi:carboxypeptidase family protein/TonB-dependent receptor-like protein